MSHRVPTRVAATALALLVGCVQPEVFSLEFDVGDAVTMEAGTSRSFTVTMEATDPTPREVAWEATCGEVMGATRRMTYVAPDAPGECTVTATSLFDATKSARLVVTVVAAGGGGKVLWTRQFGSDNHDFVRRIAVHASGASYVVGETQGALDGTHLGDSDVFLRRYEADGTLAWGRQFGSSTREFTNGLAVDAAGDVYVGATTYGAIHLSNAGGSDAIVWKFGADGTERWRRQFGTAEDDTAQGVAVDGDGRVWVSGWTQGALEGANHGGPDAFVRLFDSEGTEQWTRQFGSDAFDYALAIAPDGNGGAVVAGNTTGAVTGANAGGIDWFVRRFDAAGNATWTRQAGGAADDRVYGAAPRAGGGVVVGGALGGEAFVRELGADGGTVRSHEFGTAGEDLVQDVATNAAGEVVVVGMTDAGLEGENVGFFDAFVRKLGADGSVRWTRQFGTAADDYAWGVALDADGNTLFGGRTDGVFAKPWFGGSDAFVRRLGP